MLKYPLLVEAKSITLIKDILPENYPKERNIFIEVEPLSNSEKRLNELLHLIDGDDIVKKELIARGSSLLKVFKNMKITFKENVEIYTVIK